MGKVEKPVKEAMQELVVATVRAAGVTACDFRAEGHPTV